MVNSIIILLKEIVNKLLDTTNQELMICIKRRTLFEVKVMT